MPKKISLNITKEDLDNLYNKENKSILNIAKQYNVSNIVIKNLLEKYNISIKNTSRRKHKELEKILTKDFLCQEHLEKKKSIERIARENNISSTAIKNALDRYNIKHNSYLDYYTSEYFIEDTKKRLKNYTELNKYKNVFSTKDELIQYINSLSEKDRTLKYICLDTGYSYSRVSYYINLYSCQDSIQYKYNSSYYEDEITDLIKEWGITNIERNTKEYLDGQEIDIYLPDYKLGIEFNGDYWHNEKKLISKGRSSYHQKKSLLAESKGIFLFHIFEYEWNNPKKKQKIISVLRTILQLNENIYYARKCEIRLVDKELKSSFLDKYHLQGNDKSTIDLGLFYNDDLLSIMTFCPSRFSKKYNWELSRYCCADNINVIGGASKLFNYFIVNYLEDNESIVTYNDITKTRGNVYEKLGFKYDHIAMPNYVWLNLKTNDLKTRYMCQIKDEIETMTSQGYVKICDCGNKIWIYKKTEN